MPPHQIALIIRLTRVTRIFQKSVFAESTPAARAGDRAGFFVARTQAAAARGVFPCATTERDKPCRLRRVKAEIRPAGSRNRATLLMEGLLADDAEAIGRKAIAMAKQGDMAAIRLCMDRLLPAPKGEPVAFELPRLEKPADSVAAAEIVAAVAAGELTPSEAAELAKVVDVYVRAIATTAFDEPHQARGDGAAMTSRAANPVPCLRGWRCKLPVAETSGHCFATVLYNENTYSNVWRRRRLAPSDPAQWVGGDPRGGRWHPTTIGRLLNRLA